MELRQSELYGDVELSIQASESHYCTPRVSGLPLDMYTEVELGLQGPVRTIVTPFGECRVRLCLPSDIGIQGFDHLFNDEGPIAGYVSWYDVNRLREALRKRAAEMVSTEWSAASEAE